MPKVTRESATQGGDFGPVVDRFEDIDGYSIHFTTFREDIDATPLLRGLPDDRCQCPHWGYVISGRVTFRYADSEESFEAVTPSTRRPATFRSPTSPVARSSCSAPLLSCKRPR